MSNIKQTINKNKKEYLSLLSEILSIESISAQTKHQKDISKTVLWLINNLKDAGLNNVGEIKTKGNPIVYADYITDKANPTILIYGHYDVQPADQKDKWKSPPFKMDIRNERIYARGSTDNKGQLLCHILAIKELLLEKDKPPVNIKFVIEGEEEIGSVNFFDALKKNKEKLAADIALISDGEMQKDQPILEYGLRGLVYFEIEVKALRQNVHSGVFGGVVDNPINVLAFLIAELKGRDGKIKIDHFYDDVRKISNDELRNLMKVNYSEDEIKNLTGAKKVFGEKDKLNIQRTGGRPSLDVHGIWGGFMQEGSKTIIPSKANAKISMRLVPNQNPEKIKQLLYNYIEKIKPDTVDVKISEHGSFSPVLIDISSKYFKAIEDPVESVWGKKPLYKLEGGSIGIVNDFKNVLKIDTILLGYGLDDSNMHGPNENFPLDNFLKGIETTYKIFKKFDRIQK